jgi:hypothetical protein
LKIDENIPTTSNFTEEDILNVLSKTNKPEEIKTKEIEIEPQTDTEKPLSSF